MNPLFASILTILVGMYGVRLFSTGQLIYYIHPRYVGITLAACIVLIAAGMAAFFLAPMVKRPRRRRARDVFGVLPVASFIVVGLLLPARPLTSASVDQRSTSSIAPQAVSEEDASDGVTDVSGLDTSDWSFDDFWYSLMIQDRVLEHYEGKTANIVGFVSRPKAAPQDAFYLTRFMLMCCAIDAQTVGFWVRHDAGLGTVELANDTWIRVRGTFTVGEWNGKKALFIVPEEIEATEQPEDPYVY